MLVISTAILTTIGILSAFCPGTLSAPMFLWFNCAEKGKCQEPHRLYVTFHAITRRVLRITFRLTGAEMGKQTSLLYSNAPVAPFACNFAHKRMHREHPLAFHKPSFVPHWDPKILVTTVLNEYVISCVSYLLRKPRLQTKTHRSDREWGVGPVVSS